MMPDIRGDARGCLPVFKTGPGHFCPGVIFGHNTSENNTFTKVHVLHNDRIRPSVGGGSCRYAWYLSGHIITLTNGSVLVE
jgi:hypothetical protein